MGHEDRKDDRHENLLVAAPEPVAVLGLGVRASNCLRLARISTIGDLVARGADDLRRIRNLGEGTLREIVEALAERGLRLGSLDDVQNGWKHSPVRTEATNTSGDILGSDIKDLKLGVRAANCLRAIGVRTVKELVTYRPEDLLRTRNLGTTSLQQIRTVLAKHTLWLDMDKNAIAIRMARASGARPTAAAEDVARPTTLSSGVQVLKLGVRASNCLQALGIHTVKELTEWSALDLARTRSLGSRTLQQIVDALNEHGLSLRELQSKDHPIEVFRRTLHEGLQTAEAELDYIVNEVISPRKRSVVVLRMGWSGQRIRTLKELAENPELSRLGKQVTRERIRQIEIQGKQAIRQRLDGMCPRQISEALRIVTESSPIAEQNVPSVLRKHGVTLVGVHYSGLRNVVDLTGTELTLVPLTNGENPVLVSTREHTRYTEVFRILSSTRHLTFSVVDDTRKLAAQPSEMGPLLKSLIDTCFEYQWLDRDNGVYWHVPGGQPRRGNKILFQCRKLFSLCGRLHLDEIHSAVRRTRTVAKSPSKHVMLEMLRQTSWCLISGYYLQLREGIRFDELSAEDRRLVRAAKGMGSTVKFWELRDNLVREGVTSTHAGRHILFSPFLYPVSRGRYRVLFNAEDQSTRRISSAKSDRQETECAVAHRDSTTVSTSGSGSRSWDLAPSVVVQVSSRTLITDRIFVDSELPSGQWEVVDGDGCRVGRCATSRDAIHELATALRFVGTRVGDACRLRFDLNTKQVEIRKVAG